MSLARWTDTDRPPLRPGYALFEVNNTSYHAMIVAGGTGVDAGEGQQVTVHHMAPPLHVQGEDDVVGGPNHYVGWFEELAAERYGMISAELARIAQLLPPTSGLETLYDISPHGIAQDDPNNPGEQFTGPIRASCASLVEHSYETAGVDLVAEESVPLIEGWAHLARILGTRGDVLRRGMNRIQPGGEPQWKCRVLLPAYQMRAFQKRLEELPHHAQETDHPFRDVPQ